MTIPVELRPAVTANIAVHVFTNPDTADSAADILVVHGLAQTAATFRPLAEGLFTEHLGDKVARVLIAELPGHGTSSLPVGMTFGELALEDYTTVLLALLDATLADILVGHSMGGMIIQMAQERLALQGTTLRDRYDVRGAVLLAPVIPSVLPWAFVDSGSAAAILAPFVRFDATLGLYVDFGPAWTPVFYGDRSGTIAAGAPAPDEATAFSAFESFTAGGQTIRLFAPPFVRANAFGPNSGTVVGVVTLEQDAFFRFPDEHRALYGYLSGDDRLRFFFELTGPETVHNMHTFNAAAYLRPIKKVINATNGKE